VVVPATFAAAAPIKVLFLGDNGHHRPVERFRQLQPVLAARGIEITYADSVAALNSKTLGSHDGLILYANITAISPEQEKALLDYVAGGKGFIPIHCASYCFLNSPTFIELLGAQFKSHGTGVFRTTIAEPNHPLMYGFRGFESWDETYVHHKHNEKDRTVLEYRVEKGVKEPWTWVRTHGKGRVFYTAWGHDARTWSQPGFQNLIERGIRWAVGADLSVAYASADRPEMTPQRKDVKAFQYVEANVPYYPAGEKWGTIGKPISKMQLPLDPEESLKHMVTPVDFELQLFAADPQIKRPICMTWDERGRLWIAETVDYPNNKQPDGQGHDRIVILEDADGDGRADKFTVFADKLSIPTTMAFYKGGVIVQQAPHTLYLKDNDGDDVADERRVLFTGWSTHDTHAGPSNLRWGLDNWIWGMVGYSGFNGEIGGEKHRFSTGFYRFKPDGSKFEFLRNTNNNSWGVGFSEEGLLFGSTANGNPSVYMPIPNRYYEAVRGWSSSVLSGIAGNAPIHPITDKVRQVDWHGHFTAAAGHALYTARTYPRPYWNRTAFVAEPTGHLVATFLLQKNGCDFTSYNAWNLLASDDEWTAPIMAEVGPDGCVWIIDWYNYIVQHNPTPPGFKTGKGNAYETELRDKKHGRIYRLVPKGAKLPRMTLKDATPQQLVATLKHNNMFWRNHAQRLLVERGQPDVVPALIELAGSTAVDEIGLNPGAIHALWTMHGLGVLDGSHAPATAAAVKALHHPSAGVRRNAVLVLPRTAESVNALLDNRVLSDPDAHVRLAALLALAEMPPSAKAGPAIVEVLAKPENYSDRWIPDAATSAAATHDVHFLTAVTASKSPLGTRSLEVLAVVAEHYARGGPVESVGSLVAALTSAEPKATEVVLGSLAKGWPKNRPVPVSGEFEQVLDKFLHQLSPSAKGQLIKLATAWGSKAMMKYASETTKALLAVAGNEKESDASRLKAAQQFVELLGDDTQTLEKLLELISPRTSPSLAEGIIEALRASRSPNIGTILVKRLDTLTPGARNAGLRVLLSRPEGTRALLVAVDKGQVQLAELTLDQKQSLAAHPDRKIAARAKKLLARGGGLPSADRQKVIDELLPVTKRTGDVALGKQVFTKHCATCHTHSGEGNKVGPDLTGMAVHPKASLLIDIMDPSRNVEGNYRVYTVTTQDGLVLSGLLASETKTSVELIDSQAKKHTVLRENIDQFVASNKSLMPDGFEKQLTTEELANLLEFLTQRGQYLPLPLGKIATAVSTQGMFYSKEARAERLIFPDWSPKTFKGVPFNLVDPRGDRIPNVLLLYSPNGQIPPQMPKSARLPCNSPAKAIHLLSGVSGWGYPGGSKGSVTMIVRLHYADGKTEDHPLCNGEHFADYIRRVEVPQSEFAFQLRGQQVRYLAVYPKRNETITEIEFVKGEDRTAPVVMAVTVETR
jgi:putative membrane-bound dehydrogenase-like protein